MLFNSTQLNSTKQINNQNEAYNLIKIGDSAAHLYLYHSSESVFIDFILMLFAIVRQ